MSFTFDHFVAPYGEWGLWTHYVWFEGILAIPVAAPPTAIGAPRVPLKITRTSAPFGYLTVDWTASRTGVPPFIPHPNPLNSNLALASASITTAAATLSADNQTHLYSICGSYAYFCYEPIWLQDGLFFAATPYDNTPLASNALGDVFVPGYFGYQQTGGTLTGNGGGEAIVGY